MENSLKEFLKNNLPPDGDQYFPADSGYLSKFLPIDKLKKFKEFAGCENVSYCECLEDLSQSDYNQNLISLTLEEESEIRGDIEIFAIGLTSKIYNPINWIDSNRREPLLAPTMYDSEEFMPYRKIILDLPVESPHDEPTEKTLKRVKEKLHKEIDEVLENPKKYYPKGDYKVFVKYKVR